MITCNVHGGSVDDEKTIFYEGAGFIVVRLIEA